MYKKYLKHLCVGLVLVFLIIAVVYHQKLINLGKYAVTQINIETAAKSTNKIPSSRWENKTWNAVGDSITEQGIYTKLVKASMGLNAHNYGLASSTLAVNNNYLHGKSIYERVLTYPDADVWTIFGGVNDWLYKTPLGTIEDSNTDTFYGSLKATCENILKRPNKPKLILFTPLQSNRNGANDEGITMLKYRQAIIDVGKLYTVPVLDLYNNGGIDSDNLSKYTTDGIHPNISGTKIYFPEIVSAIQNLK